MNSLIATIRLFLSALLVISTGGFATYAHLCKGAVVSTSLFIPKDPCSSGGCSVSQEHSNSDNDATCCKRQNNEQEARKHCCDDEYVFLQTTPVKDEEAQPELAFHAHNNDIFAQSTAILAFDKAIEHFPSSTKRLYVLYQNFRL